MAEAPTPGGVATVGEVTPSESVKPDLSIHVFANFVKYVEDHHGAAAVVAMLAPAGLTAAQIFDKKSWASLAQVEQVLEAGRGLFDEELEFKRAFAYKLRELLGPMRYLAWAATPGQVFTQAFRSLGTLSSISRAEVTERGPAHLVVRYFSSKPESRLVCLSRQGQAAALPTLWGLPPAAFEEHSCIAAGDECCEYRISWHEARRRTPVFIGLGIGLAVAATLAAANISAVASWVTLPILGALLGWVKETQRTHGAHLSAATEQQDALRAMAESDANARQELLLLHERQRTWTRLLEEQLAERNTAFGATARRYESMLEEQRISIQGVSHDMNSSLMILRTESWQLSRMLEEARDSVEVNEKIRSIITDSNTAIDQLERMLRSFIMVAREGDRPIVPTSPEELVVSGLTEVLRRRLSALTYGRELRVSVFGTREAPERITVDRVLFDRVVDNLLTNAVKYTEAGSILLEIGGTPGFLTLKLSDTGRGIAADRIERIFAPGGNDPQDRDGDSHGVGLSVVVQLMASIGGRLEVMSKEDSGTTFWAHFPITGATADDESRRPARDQKELLAEVVNIRTAQSARS